MNRTINSKLAIAIIIFAAVAAGTFCLTITESEYSVVQEAQNSTARYGNNIARKASVSDKENSALAPAEWKLITGSPEDICSIPVYEGSARVMGWYVYDYGYSKKKEWLLRIADEDISKLPLFESNRSKKDFHLKVMLVDASLELEKRLKSASPENPVEIQISRYLAYCEGVSVASIKTAENI